MDYNKHISQKTRVQGKTKSRMLIFCFCGYWILFFLFFFFQFMNKSIHIYIPLYFCLFLLFWFYIWILVDEFFFFEELSWEDIQRERRVFRTGWVFLSSYIMLRWGFFLFLFFFGHFGSLWMSMIINPEDYCYVAVTQSVSVIRELALFSFALCQSGK